MKVVILAGGLGTRLSEETVIKPKPMVEIGHRPILWHIMKIYSAFGLTDFVICLGYKGYTIKEYFSNYFLHNSNVTFDMKSNQMKVHTNESEPWTVTLVDTGDETMTGGRVKRIKDYIPDEEFCMTYGDGLANIDIGKLLAFHREHKRMATMTAVQPPGRWGVLTLKDHNVTGFKEKPQGDGAWINGGFFVLNRKTFDYVAGDSTIWEKEPLQNLAAEGQLMAYKHEGFWQPMDTLRDKVALEEMWNSRKAPWKLW